MSALLKAVERQPNVMAESRETSAGAARMEAIAAAARAAQGRGAAPVHLWNPVHCGTLDLVVGADGTWRYQGSVIARPALVKLFATVLRRDPDGYVLVTPAEKLSITVEDAPFLAVELATEGGGPARRLRFRTNMDEIVDVGPEHALRFEQDAGGGFKPYVHVRADLWALAARSAVYDLVDLAEEVGGVLGVWGGGVFYPFRVTPS